MTVRVEHLAEGVTCILGDCLEVLPDAGPVDAVVTDPPFGIGFKYKSHVDDAEAYPDLMRAVISLTQPLVGDGPSVFWQGMLNADRWHEWFPRGFRLFAACKGFVQYRPIGVQYSWDPVVFWGKANVEPTVDRKDWHVQSLAPFGAGREKIDHPCPRPLEQVSYVVETFTEAGQTVLDPFMGSGTTGLAAVMLGRRFIGIEIEASYFDTSCRRIEQALRQGRMFIDPPKPMKQVELL